MIWIFILIIAVDAGSRHMNPHTRICGEILASPIALPERRLCFLKFPEIRETGIGEFAEKETAATRRTREFLA